MILGGIENTKGRKMIEFKQINMLQNLKLNMFKKMKLIEIKVNNNLIEIVDIKQQCKKEKTDMSDKTLKIKIKIKLSNLLLTNKNPLIKKKMNK